MRKRVIVASKNPVKVQATRIGLSTFFPSCNWDVQGHSIPSGVSDQPMSDEETRQGAVNRVHAAKNQHPDAFFWVGIEGGCCLQEDTMWVFAWVVIGSNERIAKAKTSMFALPVGISNLVQEGYELGVATDMIFGQQNTKHSQGVVGMLSNGHIDRTEYYVQPMILASVAFTEDVLGQGL